MVSSHKENSVHCGTSLKLLDLLLFFPVIGWLIYAVYKSLQNRAQPKPPISDEAQKANAIFLATKELPKFQKILQELNKSPVIQAKRMDAIHGAVKIMEFNLKPAEDRQQLNVILKQISNRLKTYQFDESNQVWRYQA